MASSVAPTRTLPTLHEFFAPGGILAGSSLPYESVPASLKWLKPWSAPLRSAAISWSKREPARAKLSPIFCPRSAPASASIVSTGTKALQDQLFFRDILFLETLLGPLAVCYMKGRANYLCRHKLVALRDQPVLSGLEEIDEYQQIAEWEQSTETGDRAELGFAA